VSVKGVAKWNGSAWSVLGSGMDDSVGALAVSGTNLYAGGYITTAGGVPANCIAKWNGSAWSALGSGIGGYDINLSVSALAVLGTNLYAGGNFTTAGGVMVNYIAKWDGSAWSALGSGMGGEVWALAVSGTNLYAGGTFSTVGGLLADYIAKWDGNVWSALGSGIFAFNVSVDVYALAVSGTDLYVGGEFTGPAGYITKWDGSAWSALGSGLDGWVRALAVSGTNLYAGGDFTTAGGVTANGIAKWDGSAWSALGSGMGGDNYFPDVLALAASGSNLYAGGNFTTAGGVPVHNIAKWNGSAWSALGSGMGGGDYYFPSVYALAVSGTDLYVGGWFTNVGGLPANCIAKWNGSAWSTLGSGMDADVRALAVSGTNLYAGGYFTNAGGVPANYVAKWNGSAWSALGQGMAGSWYNTPVVHSLALSGSDLYAGGWFTNAGGAPANYIAKWDGNAWSPLGSGISGNPVASYNQVESLAADGVGHLFVGGNFLLAGTNVSPYIAQANVGSTESLEAHFTYTITNDKITITGYTGPGGAVTIPSALNGLPVTSIGDRAFYLCTNLTSLTIPDCVTSIADYAFSYCTSLTALQFGGNAPSLGSPYVFTGDTNATIYYLPGTEGWGSTFGGRPTALWFLPNPLILTSGPGFGVQSNAFGFIISWATNLPVVVEACTNLANHSWSPVHTNALTGGWSYFSDPQWANYPGRFYRVRSP
jgi:hypothetical protein